MKLYLKNMVCDRCKLVVANVFENIGLKPLSINLGEVVLENSIDTTDLQLLERNLEAFGFEIIQDKKIQIVEQIKSAIIALVHEENQVLKMNLSAFLQGKLSMDYTGLSLIFSATEGQTIEKYFIAQKIEKAKELLSYDELNLSEIAYRLNYSSVAHLSAQFKKVTGFTPSQYKPVAISQRRVLNKI